MKKAIVLGATSGIGNDLARILAHSGYRVGITGRREKLLEDLKSEIPEMFVPKAFDINEIGAVDQKLNELVKELGGLDLLVISSAIHSENNDLDFDIDKKLIGVNVLGFTAVCDWAYNYYRKQGYGHLVAITSISGLRGSAKAMSYAASKSYQINYLQGLRQMAVQEGKPIAITDIRPGTIATPMSPDANGFWVSSSQETASQILLAIKKRRKSAYVTRRWTIVGSVLKFIPDFVYNRLKV